MVAFKKCSTSWNKGIKFHIDQAKRNQAKGTAKDCHRSEAHVEEARRMMSACSTPHSLVESWRSTSRSVLASCASKRGRGFTLRGKREPPPVYHPRMGPPPGVPYYPEKQKSEKSLGRARRRKKSRR